MFRTKIEEGKFVITCEVLTPLDFSFDELTRTLNPLSKIVDSFNIPFCPLGKLRPHSLLTASILKEKLACDPIVHLAARHQTILGYEAVLLYAQALDIKNILCVTGDPPVEGKGNVSLTSTELLDIASSLNQGISKSRTKLPITTDFLLCAAYNPNRVNMRGENLRAKRKFQNGAQIFFTQPVFDSGRFRETVEELKELVNDVKIIGGLSFLYKKKIALKLRKFLGIPFNYIEDMEQKKEADLLLDIASDIRDIVDGFYIIPIRRYDKALEFVNRLKERGLTE